MTEIDSSPMEVENRYSKDENAAPNSEVSAAVAPVTPTADKSVLFSPQLLQMYYSRLFPYTMVHDWLSYGNKSCFSRREFSFTVEGDIYLRYQCFTTRDELAEGIMKRCPHKIDIGAVFEASPKNKHAIQSKQVKPEQRELVFDIDLTDYDCVRKCGCSGAAICTKCWGFMKMAVKVMDKGLREDFGFEKIAWFYSGRRGVHAWVCDESARTMTDQARSSVARYFEVNLGAEKNKEVELPHPLHPVLSRALQLLEPMFIEQVLPKSGHGILATPENWTEFLDDIPESASVVREKLSKIWLKTTSSPEEKWQDFKQHLTAFLSGSAKKGSNKSTKNISTKERNRLENYPAEVVFRYGYPRLDIAVSKTMNHLLKSPFCVHPKTGRVCVPMRTQDIDDFDPFTVPTLPQLMNELDQYEQQEHKPKRDIPEWKKTSLKGYFEPFEKEFLNPMTREQNRQQRDEAELKAAVTGDF